LIVNKHVLNSGAIEKYSFQIGEAPLSFSQFFDFLSSNHVFRKVFCDELKSSSFEAAAFETPCISKGTLKNPAEFVLVSHSELNRLKPDSVTFQKYYKDTLACSFLNLGKDAMLVVPTPGLEKQDYSHLMSFMRSAPEEQLDEFWALSAKSILDRVSVKAQWVSTAGLGVHWLHLRICDMPKYYRFKPYI